MHYDTKKLTTVNITDGNFKSANFAGECRGQKIPGAKFSNFDQNYNDVFVSKSKEI